MAHSRFNQIKTKMSTHKWLSLVLGVGVVILIIGLTTVVLKNRAVSPDTAGKNCLDNLNKAADPNQQFAALTCLLQSEQHSTAIEFYQLSPKEQLDLFPLNNTQNISSTLIVIQEVYKTLDNLPEDQDQNIRKAMAKALQNSIDPEVTELAKEITYWYKGRELAEQAQYIQAIIAYNLALKNNPDHPIYYLHRAQAYLKLGQQTQALADLEAMIGIANKTFPNESTPTETMQGLVNRGQVIDKVKQIIWDNPVLAVHLLAADSTKHPHLRQALSQTEINEIIASRPPEETTLVSTRGGNFKGLTIAPRNPKGDPDPTELSELGVNVVKFMYADPSAGDELDEEQLDFYKGKVAAYANAGINSLIILNYETYPNKPDFEADDDEWDEYIGPFCRRAGQLAAELAPWQPAFQIWYEPDHPVHPGYAPTLREEVYGRMLAECYTEIKTVDDELTVVAAGLATGNYTWLGRVVQAQGGQLTADAIAFHPFGQRPERNWPSPDWYFGYVGDLINNYYRAGGNLPIWITEMGVKEEDLNNNQDQVAEFLSRYYQTMATDYADKVKNLTWFAYSDGMVPTFGLLDAAGYPKPAYDAYRQIQPQEETTIQFSYRTRYLSHDTPSSVPADQTLTVNITLQNAGALTWESKGNAPFQLGFHWYDNAGQMITFPAGLDFHTPLPADISPDETVTLQARLHTPDTPGIYHLRWDMIHETVTWFTTQGDSGLLATSIKVTGARSSAQDVPTATEFSISNIEFVGSPNYNTRPDPNEVDAIVMHATANSSFQEAIDWFNNPNAKVSAHYLIDKDGTIVQPVKDEDRAWHAGKSEWQGRSSLNDWSIGIQLINLNDDQDPYPEAQQQAAVQLVTYLVTQYNIPVENIIAHYDVVLPAGRKSDPRGYDMDRLRRDVLVSMQPTALASTPSTTFNLQIQDVSDNLPVASPDEEQFPTRSLSQIDRIIIHHTAIPASVGAERIAQHRVESQGWPGIGYHYFITDDGTIQQTNDLATQSTHAGQYDPVSIGVCIAGDFDNSTPSQSQLEATAQLLAWLATEFDLTTEQIYGYKDLVVTQSPGATWDDWRDPLLTEVDRLVAGEIDATIQIRGGNFKGLTIDPRNPKGDPDPTELSDLGVNVVKFTYADLSAGDELDEGQLDFYKEKVAAYANAGINSLIILNYETYPNKPEPEADDDEWDEYIAPFCQRAGQLAAELVPWQPAFQIWLEPDIPASPGYAPTVREAVYGRMLAECYTEIKAVDDELTVVAAGLATGDHTWLERVVQAQGGQLTADAIAFHPYGQRPNRDWPDPNWYFGYVGDLIENYYQAGGNLPIWITEMGVKEEDLNNDQEQTAEFLNRYYQTVATEYADKVENLTWFAYSDGIVPTFGLLDAAGDPKPAYDAYQQIQFQGATTESSISNIEFVDSPNYNTRADPNDIDAIVMHATANSSLQGAIDWFNNPNAQISAHYLIDKDGTTVQLVKDEHRAWHAGKSEWQGRSSLNDWSIGIQLVNLNDGQDPYPEAQQQAAIQLVTYLVAKYNIPVENIITHYDVALPVGRKSDPRNYNMDRLRREVSPN